MIMINTKRIFTALLLAIIAVTGYAYDFEVDGIYYSYDVYGNAVVTHGDKKYTGKIKIPSEVKWNGKRKKWLKSVTMLLNVVTNSSRSLFPVLYIISEDSLLIIVVFSKR